MTAKKKIKPEPKFGSKAHIKKFLKEQKVKEATKKDYEEQVAKKTVPLETEMKGLISSNIRPDKKLIFNSSTGELNLATESNLPNEVVVDQIYKEGFFNKQDKVQKP